MTPTAAGGPYEIHSEARGPHWIAWITRAPFGGGVEIEIRRVFETEDFGDAMTPDMREQENRMRAQSVAAAKK